jgi:hypothetical protein
VAETVTTGEIVSDAEWISPVFGDIAAKSPTLSSKLRIRTGQRADLGIRRVRQDAHSAGARSRGRPCAPTAGVFTFGDASFYGSAGSFTLSSPVMGMASPADGLR